MFSFLPLLLCLVPCLALPDGAPEAACNDMTPQHAPHEPTPGGNDLYTIDVDDNGDGSYQGEWGREARWG
jgi:hypothetical protein